MASGAGRVAHLRSKVPNYLEMRVSLLRMGLLLEFCVQALRKPYAAADTTLFRPSCLAR
jgi:hypothetical protein